MTAGRTRTARTALLLLAAGAVVAGCDDESAHPPRADVDDTLQCVAVGTGDLRASGTVTNHSSKPSTYLIDVEFTVDGDHVDTQVEVVEDVAPGATATLESRLDDAPAGDARCVVGSVERFRA